MPPADYPATLRTQHRVSSTQSSSDPGYIVHTFEFPNNYDARVWGKQDDTLWSVILVKEGRQIRKAGWLPEMPFEAPVADINEVLTMIAAAPDVVDGVPPPLPDRIVSWAGLGGKVTLERAYSEIAPKVNADIDEALDPVYEELDGRLSEEELTAKQVAATATGTVVTWSDDLPQTETLTTDLGPLVKTYHYDGSGNPTTCDWNMPAPLVDLIETFTYSGGNPTGSTFAEA